MFSPIVALSFAVLMIFSMAAAFMLLSMHRRYELPRSVVKLVQIPIGIASGTFAASFHAELGLFAWCFAVGCVLNLSSGLATAWKLRKCLPLALRTSPFIEPADND